MLFTRAFRATLTAALLLGLIIAPNAGADAPAAKQTCGPFGNPPAKLITNVVPKCDDGALIGPWKDSDGTPRYACLYQPPPGTPPKPLPLIVYLHPSLANADSVRRYTNLLDLLKTANVSDDSSRPGFILLAPQGRNTSLNRPEIAAIGVYSAANPFQLGRDPCPQDPVAGAPADYRQLKVFNPKVPSYQVHNSCDIGGICPNALLLEKKLEDLGGNATDIIIDRNQRATDECSAACGSDPNGSVSNPFGAMVGMMRHLRWPRPWTAAILDFFRRHPRPADNPPPAKKK
ncbi:MAG: hypothetical protein HY269_00140 [Deltaproteobacteria bacterium]|nr:hypothetical protein [Deltaproteobacteria bacterium]